MTCKLLQDFPACLPRILENKETASLLKAENPLLSVWRFRSPKSPMKRILVVYKKPRPRSRGYQLETTKPLTVTVVMTPGPPEKVQVDRRAAASVELHRVFIVSLPTAPVPRHAYPLRLSLCSHLSSQAVSELTRFYGTNCTCSFSHCWNKVLDKNNFRKEGLVVPGRFWIQPFIVGKA